MSPSPASIFRPVPALGLALLGLLSACAHKETTDVADPAAAYSDVVNHTDEPVREWARIDDPNNTDDGTPSSAPVRRATPEKAADHEREDASAEAPDPALRGQAPWVAANGQKGGASTKTAGTATKSYGRAVRPGGNHSGPSPILTRGEEAALKEKQRQKAQQQQ